MKRRLAYWLWKAMTYLTGPFSMALWRYRWNRQKLRRKN